MYPFKSSFIHIADFFFTMLLQGLDEHKSWYIMTSNQLQCQQTSVEDTMRPGSAKRWEDKGK